MEHLKDNLHTFQMKNLHQKQMVEFHIFDYQFLSKYKM